MNARSQLKVSQTRNHNNNPLQHLDMTRSLLPLALCMLIRELCLHECFKCTHIEFEERQRLSCYF